jgi:hypothetical protein
MIVESELENAEDAFADADEELRDVTEVYSVVLEMLAIPDDEAADTEVLAILIATCNAWQVGM